MFNHLNKYIMSKKTVIKLEAPSKDGYETYMMDADHASNILRMSKREAGDGGFQRIASGSIMKAMEHLSSVSCSL